MPDVNKFPVDIDGFKSGIGDLGGAPPIDTPPQDPGMSAFAQAYDGILKQNPVWNKQNILNQPYRTKLDDTLRYTDPDIGFSPFDDRLEYKYADSHPIKTLGNNILQGGAKFLGTALETIATIPLALSGQSLYDNETTNGINNWLDSLNTSLPIYTTEYEQNHPILKYLTFWKPTAFFGAYGNAINNLGFTAGAIAGSYVTMLPFNWIGSAFKLTRLFGSMGRAIATDAEAVGNESRALIKATEPAGREVVPYTRGIEGTPNTPALADAAASQLDKDYVLSTGEGLPGQALPGVSKNLAAKSVNSLDKSLTTLNGIAKVRDWTLYNLSLLTAATAEASFEANNVMSQGRKDLGQKFYEQYGRSPNGDEEHQINTTVKQVADFTMGANVALLYLNNRIVWGSLFKPGKIAEQEVVDGTLRNVSKKSVQQNAETGLYEVVTRSADSKLSKLLMNFSNPGRVLATAFGEGVEEGSQFIISEGSLDYARRKYDADQRGEVADYMKSFFRGVDRTFNSNDGWDNIAGGFVGGLFGYAGEHQIEKRRGVTTGAQRLQQQADLLNTANLTGLFEHKVQEAATNLSLAKDYKDALRRDDKFTARNLKHQMLFNYVSSAIKANRFDMRLDELEAAKHLTGTEFKKMWGEDYDSILGQTASDYLDTIIKKAKDIKGDVDKVGRLWQSNPFDPKSQATDYLAYDSYKDQLALNLSTSKDYQNRLKNVEQDLKSLIPGIDVQKALEITSLQGMRSLLTRIRTSITEQNKLIRESQGNEDLVKDNVSKRDRLKQLFDELQPQVLEGFNSSKFVDTLDNLFKFYSGLDNTNNEFIDGRKQVGDTDTIYLEAKNNNKRSKEQLADALQSLQDIRKLAAANFGTLRYYDYLQTDVGRRDFGNNIQQVIQDNLNKVVRDEDGRTLTPEEAEAKAEEDIRFTVGTSDNTEETTATQRKDIRSAAKKKVSGEALTDEEQALANAKPVAFTNEVKIQDLTKKEVGNLAGKKTSNIQKTEPNPLEQGSNEFKNIDPRSVFGMFSQDKNDVQFRTNLYNAIFKSGIGNLFKNITATFKIPQIPVKDSYTGVVYTKIPGTLLYRSTFTENVVINHEGNAVGILRPADTVWLDAEGKRSIYDLEAEEYSSVTGNEAGTYGQFMAAIKAYQTQYNGLSTALKASAGDTASREEAGILNFLIGLNNRQGIDNYAGAKEYVEKNVGKIDTLDGLKAIKEFANKRLGEITSKLQDISFSLAEINKFFALSVNTGSRVQNNDPRKDTLIRDLNYKPAGTALLSIVETIGVNAGHQVSQKIAEPVILNGDELTAAQRKQLEAFIANNGDHLRNNFNRYVLVLPINGKYVIQGLVAARNAETTVDQRDSYYKEVHDAASGMYDDAELGKKITQIDDQFFIANANREVKQTFIQTSFASDGDLVLLVNNPSLKVYKTIYISKQDVRNTKNFGELVSKMQAAIYAEERKDKGLAKLKIILDNTMLKQQVPTDKAVENLAQIQDKLKLATTADVFENYGLNFNPKGETQSSITPSEQPVGPVDNSKIINELHKKEPDLKTIEHDLKTGDTIVANIFGKKETGTVTGVGVHNDQIVIDFKDSNGQDRFVYARQIESVESSTTQLENKDLLTQLREKTEDTNKNADLQYFIDKAGENPSIFVDKYGEDITNQLLAQNTTAKLEQNVKDLLAIGDATNRSIDILNKELDRRDTEVPKNPPTFGENKEGVKKIMQSFFGLDEEKATAVAEIYDHNATAWAKRTGNAKEDYYKQLGFKNSLTDENEDNILNQENNITQNFSKDEISSIITGIGKYKNYPNYVYFNRSEENEQVISKKLKEGESLSDEEILTLAKIIDHDEGKSKNKLFSGIDYSSILSRLSIMLEHRYNETVLESFKIHKEKELNKDNFKDWIDYLVDLPDGISGSIPNDFIKEISWRKQHIIQSTTYDSVLIGKIKKQIIEKIGKETYDKYQKIKHGLGDMFLEEEGLKKYYYLYKNILHEYNYQKAAAKQKEDYANDENILSDISNLWHGSPHRFNKFDISHLGSGEGAQAFGWGIYLTSIKQLAEDKYAQIDKNVQENLHSGAGNIQNSLFDLISSGLYQTFSYNNINTYYDTIENKINKVTEDFLKLKNINVEKVAEFKKEALTALNKLRNSDYLITNKEINVLKRNYGYTTKQAIFEESLFRSDLQRLSQDTKILNSLYNLESTNTLYNVSINSDAKLLEFSKPLSKNDINDFANNPTIVKAFSVLSVKTKEDIINGLIDNKSTGSVIYEVLSRYFSNEGVENIRSDKQTSEFLLNEFGYKGHRYISDEMANSENKGYGYVIYDDSILNIKDKFLYQQQKGAYNKLTNVIYALTNPDVSTPLHELAHSWEQHLNDTERQQVQKWAKTGNEWNKETSEKFARGFEKYLAEGKASNIDLQDLFDKFATWLKEVYNNITEAFKGIRLNKEMRQIYANMLGEDAISKKEIINPKERFGRMAFGQSMQNAIDKVNTAETQQSEVTNYEDLTDQDVPEQAPVEQNTFEEQPQQADQYVQYTELGQTKYAKIVTPGDFVTELEYNGQRFDKLTEKLQPSNQQDYEKSLPESLDIPEALYNLGDKVTYGQDAKVYTITGAREIPRAVNRKQNIGDAVSTEEQETDKKDVVYTTEEGPEIIESGITGKARVTPVQKIQQIRREHLHRQRVLNRIGERLQKIFPQIRYEIGYFDFNAPARFYKGVAQINVGFENKFSEQSRKDRQVREGDTYLKRETIAHEFMHPFVHALKTSNTTLYNRLVAELQKVRPDIITEVNKKVASGLYEEVTKNDEALTTYLGQEVIKAFDKNGVLDKDYVKDRKNNLLTRFFQWMQDIWDYMLGRKKTTTLDDFIGRANADADVRRNDVRSQINDIEQVKELYSKKHKSDLNRTANFLNKEADSIGFDEMVKKYSADPDKMANLIDTVQDYLDQKPSGKFQFEKRENENHGVEFEEGDNGVKVFIDPRLVQDMSAASVLEQYGDRITDNDLAEEYKALVRRNFYQKGAGISDPNISVKQINPFMRLQDVSDFLVTQLSEGPNAGVQFTGEELTGIDELEAYMDLQEPEAKEIRERILKKLDALKDTATRRLSNDTLQLNYNIINRLKLDAEDIEFVTKYVAQGTTAINMAWRKYNEIRQDLESPQTLDKFKLNRLTKELEVIKQLLGFYDDVSSIYSNYEDMFTEDDLNSFRKATLNTERIKQSMANTSAELATNWLYPYIEENNKLLAAQGYTDSKYTVTRDEFKNNLLYGTNKDVGFLTFQLGATVNSRDPVNAAFANTVADSIHINHVDINNNVHTFTKAYSSWLKRAGISASNEKAQIDYYQKHYLRKAKIWTIVDYNEATNEPIYGYLEKTALHQDYNYDQWEDDVRRYKNSLPEPKTSDDWDAQMVKVERYKNSVKDLYKNTAYDSLSNDSYFKALEAMYTAQNKKYGKDSLNYGIIPQLYRGNSIKQATKNFAKTWSEGDLKDNAKNLSKHVSDRLASLHKDQTAVNLDGTVYRVMNKDLATLKDEDKLERNLQISMVDFIIDASRYESLRDIQWNAENLRMLIEGNTKFNVAPRKVGAEDLINSVRDRRAFDAAKKRLKELEKLRKANSPEFKQEEYDKVKAKVDEGIKPRSVWDKFLPRLKQGQTEKLNKQLSEMLNDVFYGESEFASNLKVGNQDVSLNKIGHAAGMYTSLVSMAFNKIAGVANVLQGDSNIWIEALGGKHYTMKDVAWATGHYFKNVPKYIADLKNPIHSKDTQLALHYDAIQGEYEDEYGLRVSGNIMRRMLRPGSLFMLTKLGEHQIQLTGMLSLMHNTKVKTNTGETINLYDAYAADSEGRYKLRSDVKFTEDQQKQFKRTLHGINRALNGNYNELHKGHLQRTWYGKQLIRFRKWIYEGFRTRWSSERVDFEKNTVETGYLYYFMNDFLLKGLLKREFNLIKRYKNLTPDGKYRVRKASAELSSYVALWMLAVGLRGDDDKHLTETEKAVLLFTLRLRGDLGIYHVEAPSEAMRMFDNPSASVAVLRKIGDVLIQLRRPNQTYARDYGIYHEGDNMLLAKFRKTLPVLSRSSIDWDSYLKYYQLIKRDVQ